MVFQFYLWCMSNLVLRLLGFVLNVSPQPWMQNCHQRSTNYFIAKLFQRSSGKRVSGAVLPAGTSMLNMARKTHRQWLSFFHNIHMLFCRYKSDSVTQNQKCTAMVCWVSWVQVSLNFSASLLRMNGVAVSWVRNAFLHIVRTFVWTGWYVLVTPNAIFGWPVSANAGSHSCRWLFYHQHSGSTGRNKGKRLRRTWIQRLYRYDYCAIPKDLPRRV